MKYWDLKLPALEASPKNVRIGDAMPRRETRPAVSRSVFIVNAARTLPATGDVRVNVQYGENGTEYTGTYAPGGAGIKTPGVNAPFVKGDN